MKKTLRLEHMKLKELYDALEDTPAGMMCGPCEDNDFNNLVIFWISEQSHRGAEFDAMNCQIGSFTISSNQQPEWDYATGTLYVRGSDKTQDNRKLLCTLDEWERIEAAVKEYNEVELRRRI